MTLELIGIIWLEYLYPALCMLVPCTIYHVLRFKLRRPRRPFSMKHLIWSYLFIFYLIIAINTAGIGTIYDLLSRTPIIHLEEINLIPFQSAGFMTYLLNIIMFIPLGFLLPYLWKSYGRPLPTILTGFLFSLSIELAQLFVIRVTDIDDLIMNTLGTILGFLIWKLYDYIVHTVWNYIRRENNGLSPLEPIAYLCCSMLGIFFLFHWRYFIPLFYPT